MATTWASEAAALNGLLERERACVAVVVALARGATERAEREACASLGGDLIVRCCALRERLELAGIPCTHATAPDAAAILSTDSYDARLLAFAKLLERAAEQATEVLAATADGETQRTLRDLIETHSRAVEWCRARAAEFAASRMLYLAAAAAAEPSNDQSDRTAASGTQISGSHTSASLPERSAGESESESESESP